MGLMRSHLKLGNFYEVRDITFIAGYFYKLKDVRGGFWYPQKSFDYYTREVLIKRYNLK